MTAEWFLASVHQKVTFEVTAVHEALAAHRTRVWANAGVYALMENEIVGLAKGGTAHVANDRSFTAVNHLV